MATTGHRRRCPQIAESTVGATADEADIHRHPRNGGAGLQIHVAVSLLGNGSLTRLQLLKPWNALIDAQPLPWCDAPGDSGGDAGRIKHHLVIHHSVGIAGKTAPPGHRPIPGFSGRGSCTTVEVIKRDLIRIDVTATGSALDCHVAEGHPLLHRQRLHRRAGEFIGKSDSTFHAERPDHMKDQILGGNPIGQTAVHLDATDLELGHGQALTGQHIPHLTGADAEGDGAKGSMG